MIKRIALVAAWLAATGAVMAGLYWAFLNTPESSTFSLALSAAIVLISLIAAACAGSAAILLAHGERFGTSIGGARRAHWLLLAAIVGALLTYAVLRGDAWIAEHSGEISAWFIATFNWSDISALLRAADYLSIWLRWVLIPAAVVAAAAAALRHGAAALTSTPWVRALLRWQTLGASTLAFLVLIALPWRLVSAFTPRAPITLELAVAGLRLSLVAALMVIGAAVMVLAATRAGTAGSPDGSA